MLFEKFTSADLSQIARESCDYLLIVHMYMQKFDSLFLFYVSPFVIVWGGRGGGAGARENMGRKGYGRREKKGREAREKFKKASFRYCYCLHPVKETNTTTFLDFHLTFSEA